MPRVARSRLSNYIIIIIIFSYIYSVACTYIFKNQTVNSFTYSPDSGQVL